MLFVLVVIMGVNEGPQQLYSGKKFTHSLQSICNSDTKFPNTDDDRNPLVGVDVSIFMVSAINTNDALQQSNM